MSARETLNRWVEAMQILCGHDDNPGAERRAGYEATRTQMIDAAYAELAAEVRRADADSFERYPWYSDGALYDKGRDAAIEWVVSTLRRRAEVGEPDTPQGDASFFQPGRTYAEPDGSTDWAFRCDTVTTHPEDGERTALGWRHFQGQWTEYAYGEDDWDIHQHVGHTDVTEGGESQ